MPVTPRKPWTVLIYMVADDPQGGELLDNQAVSEMDHIVAATLSVNKDVKEDEGLYVGLQVDFRSLPGVWRRVIGGSTFVRPESNAADPATLYGFFEWAADTCPADRYLLIFWGHSRGQFGLFGDTDQSAYTAQTLTLDELHDALRAAKQSLGKAVDVIAFKDCFMATIETAYELYGLAEYLLASPGLVPIEGWPYKEMFTALTKEPKTIAIAAQLLSELGTHYEVEKNRKPFPQVPYSLLSTNGASVAVAKLGELVGNDRTLLVEEEPLQKLLDAAAKKSLDNALVDLGALVLGARQAMQNGDASLVGPQKTQSDLEKRLDAFAKELGNAGPGTAADDSGQSAVLGTPVSSPAADQNIGAQSQTEGLVIAHTGTSVGGVSAFVYPKSPRAARDSRLTFLADARAYRQLAISSNMVWANIALGSMPIQPARLTQDVATAIAMLEQLERLGIGMAYGGVAGRNTYYRDLVQRSRSGNLTDADIAQATEYAAIAEIASRLAAFAAGKGIDGFGFKGIDGFGPKGIDGFGPKGIDGFGPKGIDGFGPQRG